MSTGQARRAIAACDTKLGQYRAALEAGSDPVLVTKWITKTQDERARLERQLAEAPAPKHRMGSSEVRALVESLGDIGAVLRRASPEDKARVYQEMDLRLTYTPENTTVC